MITILLQIKNTKDESRLGHIINVLSKLDTDNDGVITIEEVRKVTLVCNYLLYIYIFLNN